MGVNGDAGIVTGVQVNDSGNTVGGGNVISANERSGIQINGDDNIVVGNLIGLAPGDDSHRQLDAGIALQEGAAATGSAARSPATERHLGDVFDGINAQFAIGTTILGNYIGTDISGTVAVGNTTGAVSRTARAPSAAPSSTTTSSGRRHWPPSAMPWPASRSSPAGLTSSPECDLRHGDASGRPIGIEALSSRELTIQGNRIGVGSTGAALPNSTGSPKRAR